MLHVVHTRIEDEREVIICNEFGQPVGPVREGKDVVGKFSRFLGTIARNNTHAPLIHSSWQKVPHKQKIWEYVLEKYDVPDVAKTWVLKTIGQSYKVHKCRFKQKHFYQFKDNKTRWNNRPNNIPEDDFRQLLRLWSNKDVEKRCARAKQSRMSQKNMHTAGPKSFARIREEMVIFFFWTHLPDGAVVKPTSLLTQPSTMNQLPQSYRDHIQPKAKNPTQITSPYQHYQLAQGNPRIVSKDQPVAPPLMKPYRNFSMPHRSKTAAPITATLIRMNPMLSTPTSVPELQTIPLLSLVHTIEQMKSYKITENDNTTIDPFLVVMNKENYGYRRLYGRGVTNTMIKKLDGASTSYIIPDGVMESFKANVDVEKNQLIEMRKEIEDDHERKKAELEAMREDIDSQRQNLEAMMQKVLKQLPLGDSKD
ncbi:hypothetical protein E3N88_04776 [Mikania micrantha]|uniref:Uncharacterized protein n=1 Tax=Mikania micrantha TaxID=192012 RepID=A0A5N6PXI9_9ASTR|nr:hypothetical protein E3N88_04776 [Mikania micrantha]